MSKEKLILEYSLQQTLLKFLIERGPICQLLWSRKNWRKAWRQEALFCIWLTSLLTMLRSPESNCLPYSSSCIGLKRTVLTLVNEFNWPFHTASNCQFLSSLLPHSSSILHVRQRRSYSFFSNLRRLQEGPFPFFRNTSVMDTQPSPMSSPFFELIVKVLVFLLL